MPRAPADDGQGSDAQAVSQRTVPLAGPKRVSTFIAPELSVVAGAPSVILNNKLVSESGMGQFDQLIEHGTETVADHPLHG